LKTTTPSTPNEYLSITHASRSSRTTHSFEHCLFCSKAKKRRLFLRRQGFKARLKRHQLQTNTYQCPVRRRAPGQITRNKYPQTLPGLTVASSTTSLHPLEARRAAGHSLPQARPRTYHRTRCARLTSSNGYADSLARVARYLRASAVVRLPSLNARRETLGSTSHSRLQSLPICSERCCPVQLSLPVLPHYSGPGCCDASSSRARMRRKRVRLPPLRQQYRSRLPHRPRALLQTQQRYYGRHPCRLPASLQYLR
jgi:hypothetical protein